MFITQSKNTNVDTTINKLQNEIKFNQIFSFSASTNTEEIINNKYK